MTRIFPALVAVLVALAACAVGASSVSPGDAGARVDATRPIMASVGPTSARAADLTGQVSTTHGGTGLDASGPDGNIPVSNGATWVSKAPPAPGATSVTGSAPLTCSPTTGAVSCSIAASTTSVPGSMSAAQATKLANLEAGITSVTGGTSLACQTDAGGHVRCGVILVGDQLQAAQTMAGDVRGLTDASVVVQATGLDGGFTVPASEVMFDGLVTTRERTCNASGCTMVLPVPVGASGFADVIFAVRQGDGGANGGAAQFRCGVLNNGGTCKTWSACTATTAYASTDAGGAWAPTVAVTSCSITVTAPAVGGLHFASTIQVAVAK